MKKILLVAIALSISVSGFSQQAGKQISSRAANVAMKVPMNGFIQKQAGVTEKSANKTVSSALSSTETQIGNTWFDFQSNGSMPQRIYEFNDGSIGACWAYGVTYPIYNDRGTAYNYSHWNTWGTAPAARIEDVKTGYPCYAPWGAEGEIIVSHTNTNNGLKIAKRANRGSGTWSLTNKTGPAGHANILWPRVTTSGANNEFIHIVALTAPKANGGTLLDGQNGSLVYSRSADGGNSWSINNVILPGTDTTYYSFLNSDCYAFAKPVGNNLAFVYGNKWTDVFLLKSTDNGDTWTKTMIFQHPYPKFDETTTLVTDTPYVCDNYLSVALDNTGKAYVFFGIQRVTNDILNDSSFSIFPFTDGLACWSEGQAAFTSLDPLDLEISGNLVGWTQDVNGNDTIMEFVASPAMYSSSVTSMPTATIDQVNNRIYLFFTSVVEGLDNGSQNYRHIYVKRSDDLGASWIDFGDVTGDVVHDNDECVFPSVSPTADQAYCHLVYQKDQLPGMSFDGDMDPAANNSIVYLKYAKLGVGIQEQESVITHVAQNYPNPFSGTSFVDVRLTTAADISLEVSNALGQLVLPLVSLEGKAGLNVLPIDGSTLNPGLFYYTVKAGDASITRKMIVY